MMKKNLLVTGGAGFIGSNFVHYWMGNYPEDSVVVLDALTYAGNLSSLDKVKNQENYRFVKGNICDTELVEKLLVDHDIDVIVHFAAESHVDRSITGPDEFITTNIVGTHSLLKAAKKVWLNGESKKNDHRFHHVSTDEVYGSLGPKDAPFREDFPYEPNSPYSASKASSDHLVRAYYHTYGLNITTSNCSNNYGPFHFPEKLLPLVITNILNNKPLPIYGDGKQVRDWLFVEDHAYGIDLVLNKGKVGENYNIGGHNEWKNIDMVTLVCQLMDKAFSKTPSLKKKFPNATAAINGKSNELISYVTDRPGHDRRYAIDAQKSKEQLGYEPRYHFLQGIEVTIQWFLNNEKWWQSILNGNYLDR